MSSKHVFCVLGVGLAILTGCATISPLDVAQVAAHTTVEHDTHMGVVRLTGPTIQLSDFVIGGSSYLLRLTDKPRVVQLYVDARLSDWAFLDTAYSEGNRLSVTAIKREVVSCYGSACKVSEAVAINFTTAELERLAQKQNFSVKISGTHGSFVLAVPGSYFAGFLQGVRDELGPDFD